MDDSTLPGPEASAPLTSYAQNFEDVILWRALRQVKDGFYVDVGAQDPLEDSVSLGFYEKGWRGVHVEPTLHYAEKLRAARPDETVIQAAIAADAGLLHFYEVVETGLSTGDAAQAEHHRQAGFTVRETDVPSIPLSALLDRFADRPVHWLKIDVEGFEKQVLESWGESAVRPWIVVVEAVLPGTQVPSHESWDGLILAKGYQAVYFDGLNRYYLSDERKELAVHFRSGPNVFDEFVLSGTSTNRFSRLLLNRADALRETIDRQAEAHEAEREAARALLDSALGERDQALAEAQHFRFEAQHFQTALDELHVLHTQAMQDAQNEAARAAADLYAVNIRLAHTLNSTSWKVTRPLRLAGRTIERAIRLSRRAAKRLISLPGRAPAMLLAALRNRPGLKRTLVALVDRFPGLAARLRRHVHRPSGPTVTSAPIVRPAEQDSSHLSASARQARLRLTAPRSRGTHS